VKEEKARKRCFLDVDQVLDIDDLPERGEGRKKRRKTLNQRKVLTASDYVPTDVDITGEKKKEDLPKTRWAVVEMI